MCSFYRHSIIVSIIYFIFAAGRRCVEEQNENCKFRMSDSAHPLAMKIQLVSVKHLK
jgi:hypothetical protein